MPCSSTLARHGVEQGRAIRQGLARSRLHGEVQAAGESNGTKHAQGIFLKATPRLPHRTDLSTCKVVHAVKQVENTADRMPSHGVNGKVATGEVFLHTLSASDFFRMATVGIKAVKAVGSDLDALASGDSRDAAEFDSGLDHADPRGLESSFALLPRCRAAHIDIVGRRVHEGIAHPSADDPCLEARRLERT